MYIQITYACSMLIERKIICFYELRNFGYFRVVNLYNSLHESIQIFYITMPNITSLLFKTPT